MNQEVLPRILCVDDEPRVVESLAVQLRHYYQIVSANSGQQALRVLKDQGPFAVVVSDMRMPAMDGATLLKHVKQLYPETTRILLTGDTGRDAAIAAVNEGQIFKFLSKPCRTEQLKAAIDAGVMQHRLVVAEKVLLQQTLIGCIEALVDVLAITNPVAFGRSTRLKRLATGLAEAMGTPGFWQLEAAAMLSQVGYISLPVELVEKLYYGTRLTSEERVLADGAPQVAQKLLCRIARLEPVLEILDAVWREANGQLEGCIKQGADSLKLLLEYDSLISLGASVETALNKLRGSPGRYDLKMLQALESLVAGPAGAQDVFEVVVGNIKPGMIFIDDLHTSAGTLLVPKGFEVTQAFLERARNFGPGILQEKVRMTSAGRSAPKSLTAASA
jgi:response regulator RpfG family c-di-GMP phosphodiesterase